MSGNNNLTGSPVTEQGKPGPNPADAGSAARRGRWGESIVMTLLASSALVSVLVTVGIVVSLMAPLGTFFSHVGVGEFLTGTSWTAGFGEKFNWNDKNWGVLPLVA